MPKPKNATGLSAFLNVIMHFLKIILCGYEFQHFLFILAFLSSVYCRRYPVYSW